MKMQLAYTINLVLLLNCVIIVAKNDTESETKLDDMKLNIFAEGLSQNHEEEPKRRIFGRKGVIISANDTISNETIKSSSNIDVIHDVSANSSITENNATSSVTVTVLKNNITNTHNVTTETSKLNQTEQKTILNNPVVSTNLSSSVSNTPKQLNTSDISAKSLTTTSTSKTTTTTTTTTQKPKKPEITYSADDDPQIRESEKNINYNVANEKSDELPKVEQDIDRTMMDEKRARNSYMLYLGLVFALPTTFVLINIAYRRIKTYLELRHYTRVDFLVDGMYVS